MDIKDTISKQQNGVATNRRVFLTGAASVGGAAAVASIMPSTSSLAATPAKGGHMRFAMSSGSTDDVLDPGKVLNGFLSSIHYAITNTLTEMDAQGRLVPKLAEKWGASKDARKWTFTLRKGVTFQNGKPLTPDDVIASINHHRGKDSSSSAKSLVAPVEEIKADGRDVVFSLSGGDADFPYKLSSFNFPIYPANADGTLNWQSHIGVGGYVLKDINPGVQATMERNPDYWQAGERAHFDSCELLTIADAFARQSALLAGEADGIDRLDLKTASKMSTQHGVTVNNVPGKTQYTFPMRTDMAPFDDNNVRMAVKLAVDRQQLLDSVLQGYGSLGNDQPISAAYRFFDASLKQRAYDPDEARHYLKKSGLSNLSIELSAADAAFAGAIDAAVLISEQASKAGISIKVKREPNDGYWSNVWMKKPFSACYWPGYPTPDSILTQAYAAGGSWNDTYWDNERFNKLLVEARSELDDTRRAEMYAEMERILSDDGGVLLPLFANDVFATSDKVGHGKLSSNYEVDGRMFIERWWFKNA